MAKQLFIGVDGGATKCIVRVEDEQGHCLGQKTSGAANIRLSIDQAWQSINAALNEILTPLSISLKDKTYQFHAGMGLAGCEVQAAYQGFIQHPHVFNTLVVSSDSHTACLGAHGGADGAIIIAGTGVVGLQIQHGRITQVGGWGFPQDDEGGGAWLGLEAVRVTLQWLDGRLPVSDLATAIFAYFDADRDQFVSWTNNANSTAYAALAPIVIQQSQRREVTAILLLQRAAVAVDRISDALLQAQDQQHTALACSLVGGIAPFLEPYLGASLRARMRPAQATPEAGAIMLVRSYLAEKEGIK